ncbi:unnamed protein product [Taenia asiatica]|uniref:Secreted protein n=1 Tax=Taenia asiatica TaxID=60517 RepID=A0A0R3WGP0_TAEAS|nr:unnamed protein product [Taenia asiatica]
MTSTLIRFTASFLCAYLSVLLFACIFGFEFRFISATWAALDIMRLLLMRIQPFHYEQEGEMNTDDADELSIYQLPVTLPSTCLRPEKDLCPSVRPTPPPSLSLVFCFSVRLRSRGGRITTQLSAAVDNVALPSPVSSFAADVVSYFFTSFSVPPLAGWLAGREAGRQAGT